jgi:hypothetical protein
MPTELRLLLAALGIALAGCETSGTESPGVQTTGVSAQPTQIGGVVTLKLSDPGGASEPWRVQRQLLRTWPAVRSCEAQKMSFVGFHLGRVEGLGLVTPSGTSPVIEVESVECMSTRELRNLRNLSSDPMEEANP